MGSEGENESEIIPCLKFLGDFKEGSEEWKELSKKVREACERHGCFILINDMVPKGLRDDMFLCMKELFDLPEETKRKHISPKAYRSYNCDCPLVTLCQSFGIDDVPISDSAHAFTNLMWPRGNPSFCDTLNSTSSKMFELTFMILKMILEGYGLPKQYTSDIEEMKSSSNFRLIKYIVPQNDEVCEIGLLPHTDKSALTILCENEVQGLEVLTKTNKWIPLKIPQEGFVVLVGDILKAWSNGRLDAATHRVMMKGEKERYSFALFSVPKEEVKIEVPPELVEDNMYPLRYKPFNYGEYFKYFVSTLKENALDVFAGV
ncbi:probable 2-oxoglutarate-dependent dioxygenase AOP1 [Cajanus cajan]|uniref:2-oxoglutarate-dependent dioxygenase DAO n=1 Tax=Cajanus cajan TaxID=3821 RepID=A0A151QVV7_CAJCA|nr:probable 2-oxoglutarate-dependent dioxygenase AOP1 [Cajanus cajan]KYP34434.1 Gibberellin 20 oxidase 3 [Cajanus cajan]